MLLFVGLSVVKDERVIGKVEGMGEARRPLLASEVTDHGRWSMVTIVSRHHKNEIGTRIPMTPILK